MLASTIAFKTAKLVCIKCSCTIPLVAEYLNDYMITGWPQCCQETMKLFVGEQHANDEDGEEFEDTEPDFD